MPTPKSLPTIAIFVPSSAVGGAEHYVKNILPLVIESGFKPVLVLSEDEKLINFYQNLEVDCLTADIAWEGDAGDLEIGSSYLGKLSRQYRQATKVLEALQPDCVLINLPWVDFGLGISLACHDLQLPCTNLIHLCPWRVELNDLTKRLFQQLAQANASFYTVSDDNRIQLSLSTGIELDNIQVFYNSRDVENSYAKLTSNEYKLNRLELLEEFGFPLNSFLSVSVGRFSHQKNFSDIITAFAAVQNRLPNYYHLFLGEGELQAEYQAIAKDLGISHKLKFLGYRQDVDRFLALSDLFISTSLYEGLALSILEAAQFSCPIIAADSSSVREIISSNDLGLLYSPGQCYQLEKQIEYACLNSGEMQQKAQNLKHRCQQVFSREKFTADLDRLLQNLLGRAENFVYPDLPIAFSLQAKMLEVKPNFGVLQYQYRGLPESIIKTENIIEFPVLKYVRQAIVEEHDKYLHCLHKITKRLRGLKTILCFGDFDPNFFRSSYLEENHLLLIVSRSQSQSLTVGMHLIDRTCWGQELEPDCLANFTTFEADIAPPDLIKDSKKESNTSHYYTSKELLQSYFSQSDRCRLDVLSMNLKIIDDLLKPEAYYMLEDNAEGQKLKLQLLRQSA